jgi:hypothetical protein
MGARALRPWVTLLRRTRTREDDYRWSVLWQIRVSVRQAAILLCIFSRVAARSSPDCQQSEARMKCGVADWHRSAALALRSIRARHGRERWAILYCFAVAL